MNKKLIPGLMLLATAMPTSAYKELTHEQMSEQAVDSSVLGNSELMKDWGLRSLEQTFQSSRGENRSVRGLFRFGAHHEDRINPDERSRHHFFDPRHNRALTALGAARGEKSPDWILLGQGQQSDEYSYRTAQELFRLALSAPAEGDRERAWGLMFQTLGHVIHHLQDMAQPQHVRNDIHLDPTNLTGAQRAFAELFKDPSHYEAYTLLSINKWRQFLDDAALVHLPTARRFWTSGNTETGSGIADFTNRNFVSKESNFTRTDGELSPSEDYALPRPGESRSWALTDPALGISNADELCRRLFAHPMAHRFQVEECEIELIESVVVDRYTGETAVNPRASSFSVFDQYLSEVENRRGLFTLNFLNFDSAHRFLIPRAVAYSAGLIDYFFRGRLEQIGVDVVDGVPEIRIRNVSPEGFPFSNGEFSLYYDTDDGQRRPLELLAGRAPPADFGRNDEHVIRVVVPRGLDLDTVGKAALVFDGTIGQERGIAGLMISLTPWTMQFSGSALVTGRAFPGGEAHDIEFYVTVPVEFFADVQGHLDDYTWEVNGIPLPLRPEDAIYARFDVNRRDWRIDFSGSGFTFCDRKRVRVYLHNNGNNGHPPIPDAYRIVGKKLGTTLVDFTVNVSLVFTDTLFPVACAAPESDFLPDPYWTVNGRGVDVAEGVHWIVEVAGQQ